MNKLFLVLIQMDVNRDELIKYLSSSNYISFWFYHLPNSFYVRSHLNPDDLRDVIMAKIGTPQRLLVVHLREMPLVSGRIPTEHMPLFKNLE